jgi:hypothetical protein
MTESGFQHQPMTEEEKVAWRELFDSVLDDGFSRPIRLTVDSPGGQRYSIWPDMEENGIPGD